MLSELSAQVKVFPKLEAAEAFVLLQFTRGILDTCVQLMDADLILLLTAISTSTWASLVAIERSRKVLLM